MYTKPAMAGGGSVWKPAAASGVTANELGTPTRNVLSGRATYLGIPRPPVCLISRQSRALHRPTSAASWIIGGTPSPDEKCAVSFLQRPSGASFNAFGGQIPAILGHCFLL